MYIKRHPAELVSAGTDMIIDKKLRDKKRIVNIRIRRNNKR
jgi:hypothetical protein